MSSGCHHSSVAWPFGAPLYECRKPGPVASDAESLSPGCRLVHLISLPSHSNFKWYSLAKLNFFGNLGFASMPVLYSYFYTQLTDEQQGLHEQVKVSLL